MEFKSLGKSEVNVAALGMGTWNMNNPEGNVESLKKGIKMGMTFIDTAEMYGSGKSEEVVGKAIKGVRDKVFIATKVLPQNLRYDDLIAAADRSLKRLDISTIDLYQIHWSSTSVPIGESIRAMEHLVDKGKIRFIGVSNFSVRETKEAQDALSKYELVSNQVEYSLVERGIEADLLPYCQRENITVIAYTPLGHGRILHGNKGEDLRGVANKLGRTPIQVALNWLISKPGVTAIPKSSRIDHLEENFGAVDWKLSAEDAIFLDNLFR